MNLLVAERLSSFRIKQRLTNTELKATGIENRCDTMTDNMKHELPSNTDYKGHSMTRQMSRSCLGKRGEAVGKRFRLKLLHSVLEISA
jgi:hypothetical protein